MSIQRRDGLSHAEPAVTLGQLRCRALCLVPVTLRVPRPIRFPALCTPPSSPRDAVTENSLAEPTPHTLLAPQRQYLVGALVKCFFMDSLLAGDQRASTAEAGTGERRRSPNANGYTVRHWPGASIPP